MQPSLPCPRCSAALTHRPTARGVIQVCETGCGASVSAAVLRQNAEPLLVSQMWQLARLTNTPSERRCPHCRKPMRAFHLTPDGAQLDLDACIPCMLLWFDSGELGRVGARFDDKDKPDPVRMELLLALYAKVEADPAPREPSVHHGITDAVFSLLDWVLMKIGWWSRPN